MRPWRPLALALIAVSGSLGVGPAAAAGQELWRECRVCHMVAAPDGTVLERGGRSAPNLYGVAGRQAGSDPDFRRYSEPMLQAGREGLTWTEDNFVAYLRDTQGFLSRFAGTPDSRGHMNAGLADGAAELFRYLESLSR